MFKSFKLTVSLSVLAIIAVSLIFASEAIAAGNVATNSTAQIKNEKIIVYYFYSKPRCVSCKKIEAYTQKAVEEFKNKKVTYTAIDLDNTANKHYSEQYKLFTKSVVLSKQKNGKETKWKNLGEIWTKLGNEQEFKTYITTEIKKFGG
jgi:thiol-disulfide isomerase/thioredoxin